MGWGLWDEREIAFLGTDKYNITFRLYNKVQDGLPDLIDNKRH